VDAEQLPLPDPLTYSRPDLLPLKQYVASNEEHEQFRGNQADGPRQAITRLSDSGSGALNRRAWRHNRDSGPRMLRMSRPVS